MKYLLATTGTIEEGVGFALFDACHLTWLTGFVLFTLLCCLTYRRMSEGSRRRMRIALASAIVADEGLKMATLLAGGNFSYGYLPLHLCSINLFLIAWHAFRPSKVLDNYLYAVCVPAALAALLCPNWTALPPSSLMHIHSFTFHMLLACYPLMLLAGGEIRPRVRTLPGVTALLACLVGVAAMANRILGTNFMFLSDATPDNPLYWFEKHWGHHLWGYAVLVPLLLGGMYAPELLRSRRRHRPQSMAHT
ncbi:MAG: YwaF family protein [Aristaeellaceae bacterium]